MGHLPKIAQLVNGEDGDLGLSLHRAPGFSSLSHEAYCQPCRLRCALVSLHSLSLSPSSVLRGASSLHPRKAARPALHANPSAWTEL